MPEVTGGEEAAAAGWRHGREQARPRRGGVLRHRGFRLLVTATAMGQLGAQVTLVALPLTAVLELHASAFGVGLLTAAATAAFLVAGLPAGVWVDRMRRRPILIAAGAARAAALGSIPVAAVAGVLTMPQLYAVALVTGLGNVFYDVAHLSFLPALVGRPRLAEANARIEVVFSAAMLGGPAVGGFAVQLLSAAGAIILDAAGNLITALLVGAIRVAEPPPDRSAARHLGREIAEGLRFVLGHRVLRLNALCGTLAMLSETGLLAVQPLFLVHELGLRPGWYGVVLAAAASGGLAGSLAAYRVIGRLGTARSLWLPATLAAPLILLAPLAAPGWRISLYPLGIALSWAGWSIQNVAQVSYRQAVTPEHLLGRMNATVRFLMWGAMPLGGLLGGILGSVAGVHVTVGICAVGMMLAVVPLLAPAVRHAPSREEALPGRRG
ncbi:MAG: MFS transporter [Actinobacteria bacterium]|nr:MFS transporter [Actinomycetota bacterium]